MQDKEKEAVTLPFLEREINERSYRANRHDMTKWTELGGFLAKQLGNPFKDLLFGNAAVPLDQFISGNLYSSIAVLIIGNLSKDGMDKFLELMGSSVQYRNKKGGWSYINKDRIKTYWPLYMQDLIGVTYLYLEVQYRDFFSGASALPERPSGVLESPEENTPPDPT